MSLGIEVTYVGAERILPSGKSPIQVSPSGRRCKEDGCLTILSIYNPGSHCSLHQPDMPPSVRGVRGAR